MKLIFTCIHIMDKREQYVIDGVHLSPLLLNMGMYRKKKLMFIENDQMS